MRFCISSFSHRLLAILPNYERHAHKFGLGREKKTTKWYAGVLMQMCPKSSFLLVKELTCSVFAWWMCIINKTGMFISEYMCIT